MKLLVVSLLLVAVKCEICPDTTPANHYPISGNNGDVYTAGIPTGGAKLTGTLSECDLYNLQLYCVDKINWYRTTAPPFSNGWAATFAANTLSVLGNPDTPMLQCMNEKAMSDLVHSENGAGCGHHTFGKKCDLPFSTGSAENSCCTRNCHDLDSCKATLDGCLTQMYDEGIIIIQTGDDSFSSATGHYLNMIGNYANVVCGNGFDGTGKVVMTQNFFGSGVENAPCTYNCGNDASQDQECGRGVSVPETGKCFGVTYCEVNADCATPPSCYTAPGVCNAGTCSYPNEATTCTAGTCSAGVCTQSCADANCGHCTASAVDSCDTCNAGFDLVGACCKDAGKVTVSGAKYSQMDGDYTAGGQHNGDTYYEQDGGSFFIVNYCCGWGWSFTNAVDGGVYQRSEFTTGGLVASSGNWLSDTNGPVTVTHREGCVQSATSQDCTGTWSCTIGCTWTFTQTQPKIGSGADCPAAPTADCTSGDDLCVEALDCQGTWSDCPADCLASSRTFTVTQAQQGTGAACPTTAPPCAVGDGDCTAAPTDAPPTDAPPTDAPPTDAPTALTMPSDAVLQGGCAAGYLYDCKNKCRKNKLAKARDVKLGNGICNDWIAAGKQQDLDCQRLNCDMGDCAMDCKFAPASSKVGLGLEYTAEEDVGEPVRKEDDSMNVAAHGGPMFITATLMLIAVFFH